MIRDFIANFSALDQRASATVEVVDYSALALATLTVNGTALVEGTDFDAETDNDTTAGNIATAVSLISGFTASADGATVTIYWETPGTAGNAKTLASSDETNLTISGATLSGGVAATYTDSFDTSDAEEVEEQLIVTTLSGTPTLDVTPQVSLDGGDTWSDDATPFTQATGATSQIMTETLTGVKRRYKLVLGGTNPVFTGKIIAVAK